jgi:hypothetical protein
VLPLVLERVRQVQVQQRERGLLLVLAVQQGLLLVRLALLA